MECSHLHDEKISAPQSIESHDRLTDYSASTDRIPETRLGHELLPYRMRCDPFAGIHLQHLDARIRLLVYSCSTKGTYLLQQGSKGGVYHPTDTLEVKERNRGMFEEDAFQGLRLKPRLILDS